MVERLRVIGERPLQDLTLAQRLSRRTKDGSDREVLVPPVVHRPSTTPAGGARPERPSRYAGNPNPEKPPDFSGLTSRAGMFSRSPPRRAWDSGKGDPRGTAGRTCRGTRPEPTEMGASPGTVTASSRASGGVRRRRAPEPNRRIGVRGRRSANIRIAPHRRPSGMHTLAFLEPGHFHAALILAGRATAAWRAACHLYARPGPERDAFTAPRPFIQFARRRSDELGPPRPRVGLRPNRRSSTSGAGRSSSSPAATGRSSGPSRTCTRRVFTCWPTSRG